MKKAFLTALLILSVTVFYAGGVCAAETAGKAGSKSTTTAAATPAAKAKKDVPKAAANPAAKAKKDAPKTAAAKPAKAAKGKPQVAKTKTGKGKSTKVAKKTGGKKAALPKSDWSPNNFPAGNRGWCTWYADGRYSQFHGENLELNPRPNSNAHTWYKRAQNLARTYEGVKGDIMVIKRPKGDTTGHVAFVEESVPGEYWIVTHSNFDFRGHAPLKTEVIDGRKVYTDVFVPGPRKGTVMLKGGSSVYNLLGFLHRDKPEPQIAPDPVLPADGMATLAGAYRLISKTGESAASEFRGPAHEFVCLEKAELQTEAFTAPDACGSSVSTRIAL